MALGVTFAPGSQNPTQQKTGAPPLQEAIKLLSLRLPKVVGANSPIPQQLLTAPGGMGAPDPTGNPLLDMLRAILGAQTPNAMGLPGPPTGPGRTGSGVPNPQEPGATLPLPTTQKPRIIPQNPPTGGPMGGAPRNPRRAPGEAPEGTHRIPLI